MPQAAKPEKVYDWNKERAYWAFQKPKAVTPPKVTDAQWPKSEVDDFILAKLEEKGLKPVPDADKRTLIRRVYYDITGLPPTPGQVEDFVEDKSPDAYAKIVDKLLAFPTIWRAMGTLLARLGALWRIHRSGSQFEFSHTPGAIVIMSSQRLTTTNLTTALSLNSSRATCCPYTDQKERDENLTATRLSGHRAKRFE